MEFFKKQLIRLLKKSRQSWSKQRWVTVFAPSGEGSIGDQAMLDSLTENLVRKDRRVNIVYLPKWKHTIIRPAHDIINLSYKRDWPIALTMALMKSRSFVVVGADVVDGTYGEWMPLQWIAKLLRAGKFGAAVGFTNFSFSSKPHPSVTAALSEVSNINFAPREAVSLARFIAATGQPATLVADLAFLLTPELQSPSAIEANQWLVSRKTLGDTVLFVNLSGHTLSRMPGDGVSVMEDVLRRWLTASVSRSVFLVPHDSRPAPTGDVEALERVCGPLSAEFPNRVEMIRPPFAAWDVKALCGQADLAVSGRMHLTIACLGMGVPVVSVVYVGKFEGLMQHVGLSEEDLLVSTDDALKPDLLLSKIERVTTERSRLGALIKSRLDAVRALSAKNFDWL